MIKDFKKATEQLKELAEVLNSFKSEAVQLKLVEFFMEQNFESEVLPVPVSEPVVKEVKEEVKEKKKGEKKEAKEVKKEAKEVKKEVKKEAKGVKADAEVKKEVKEVKEKVSAKKSKKEKPVEVVVAEEVVKPKTKGRPRKEKTKDEKVKVVKKRIPNRPGPSIILNALLSDNYFTENRTIGNIVEQCDNQYHYKYKSTDLSGTLAKLAKEGVLSRSKNPGTNQFEYIKA